MAEIDSISPSVPTWKIREDEAGKKKRKKNKTIKNSRTPTRKNPKDNGKPHFDEYA